MTSRLRRVTVGAAVAGGLLMAAPAQADAQVPREVYDLVPRFDVPTPPSVTLPPGTIPGFSPSPPLLNALPTIPYPLPQ